MRADRAVLDGKRDDALPILEQAVAHDRKNVTLAMALAEGLARAGRTKQALTALERASANDAVGDRASLRIERARLLTLSGRGREARSVLGQDIDRLPAEDRSQAWLALGRLSANQGDIAAARRAFEHGSQGQPDDLQPRLALLEVALVAGDKSAVRDTVEALRRRSGEDDPAWRLARAAELVGNVNPSDARRESALIRG